MPKTVQNVPDIHRKRRHCTHQCIQSEGSNYGGNQSPGSTVHCLSESRKNLDLVRQLICPHRRSNHARHKASTSAHNALFQTDSLNDNPSCGDGPAAPSPGRYTKRALSAPSAGRSRHLTLMAGKALKPCKLIRINSHLHTRAAESESNPESESVGVDSFGRSRSRSRSR